MTKYAFFEGAVVPLEQATVSVMTHALHYGTACFGGIRGYWNPEHQNLYIFRLRDHCERFLMSTRLLLMKLPFSADDLMNITLDLVRREEMRQDIYIRPLAYKAEVQTWAPSSDSM